MPISANKGTLSSATAAMMASRRRRGEEAGAKLLAGWMGVGGGDGDGWSKKAWNLLLTRVAASTRSWTERHLVSLTSLLSDSWLFPMREALAECKIV